MMTLFGRKVVVTALDPVPPAFRAGGNCVVLNEREITALNLVRFTRDPRPAAPIYDEILRAMDAHDRALLARRLTEALQ